MIDNIEKKCQKLRNKKNSQTILKKKDTNKKKY